MATIAVVCIWLRNQFSIEQSNPGRGLSPNFEKKKPSFLGPREAHCTLNHVWVSQLDGQITFVSREQQNWHKNKCGISFSSGIGGWKTKVPT